MQHTATPTRMVRPWMRPVYFVLGALLLAVGIIGVVLPLVPTTGPVILAAFCFARSSRRFHDWLIHHPRFGPVIADFRAGRGIPRRTKTWALAAMAAAFTVAVILVADGWILRTTIAAVGIGAITYVARLPVSRG